MVEGVAGVGVGIGVGAGVVGTVGCSSLFFCILALIAKMITRITNPPQRIPTIQRMITRTVESPPLEVAVSVAVCVSVSETHVVPSIA